MVTLSHTNEFAHRMLTDQGCYTHMHVPDSFEDIGDAENGPQLTGGPAYDVYGGDSHDIVIDDTGLIVHMEQQDWDTFRFFEKMEPEFDFDPAPKYDGF